MDHYLWKLRPYFRQVAGQLLLGSLCGILSNTLAVLPAVMLGRAIDTALAYGTGQAHRSAVIRAAAALLGGTLAAQIPRWGKRWWLSTANARIRANIRADALRGVLAWPMERLHAASIGELMARIVADVDVLGVGIREFIVEIWDTVLFSITLIVTLFIYDPGLSCVVLFPTPLAMLLAGVTGRSVRRRTTVAREANAGLTALLHEQLAGIRVLKLFGRTGAGTERAQAQSRKLVEANLAVVRLREGLKPVYATLMVAGIVLVVALGGQHVIAGAMSVGAFVAYLRLFLRFTNRGHRIPQMFNAIQSGGVAYVRLSPLLAPPLDVGREPRYASFKPGRVIGQDDPLPDPPLPIEHRTLGVSFDGISFRYPGAGETALRQVSLDIPPGAFVAVTGPVGSGKSALLRVVLGIYPLEQGVIRLDGHPLSDMPLTARTSQIGYLPQNPYLFSGTIHENLAFGATKAETDPQIVAALKIAALEPDLETFPSGIATQIGELGVRLSGGQRQRIALARSLAATPASPGLLLLDDPFSAVDLDTEARLIAALRQAYGPGAPANRRATVLLCSHRLAAFPQADRIVVLDRGHIVETGTHAELMEVEGLYARIFLAQTMVSQAHVKGAKT